MGDRKGEWRTKGVLLRKGDLMNGLMRKGGPKRLGGAGGACLPQEHIKFFFWNPVGGRRRDLPCATGNAGLARYLASSLLDMGDRTGDRFAF